METKKFKDLTIRDAFMFAAVMSDSEICRKVLEMSLGIPISEVHIQTEKTMAYHSEYHGVRLDVYADDAEKRRFNVEMQVTLQKFLPKRSRYYHDQIDMDALLAGDSYENLPDTYVIFICDFDPFGKDKYRYTFRTTCQESENVDLEDGRTTVFLNTRGKNESEVPGELVTFLQYMKEDLEGSEKEFHDPYVEQLQKFIRNVKGSREMEERFMIFEEMLKEERAAGFAKGRAEGVAEGRISESKDTLLLFLQNLGTVPKVLSDQIEEQGDLDVLKEWIRMAFQSKSVEEFAKKIK